MSIFQAKVSMMREVYRVRIIFWLRELGVEPTDHNIAVLAKILNEVLGE